MSVISVGDFEKVYADPVPINGYVLVEVVDKDPTRTTKGGIILNEDQIANPSPYFLVRDIAEDIENPIMEKGDIVQFTERNIIFFYGRELRKLALMEYKKVAAVFKKNSKKEIPFKEESRIIVDS
jgi:hypothetical protein